MSVHLLARGLDRGGEVAALALEVRRFESAVAHHDRRIDPVDVALRAERIDHGVGQVQVLAAPGKPHRRQIVHAAHAQARP